MKSEFTEFILQNYEVTRSDDALLIYYHLRRFGFFDDPTPRRLQDICDKTISIYDLVRYRQKLQAKGKYFGTPEVMAERMKHGVKRTEEERAEKQGKKSKGQLKMNTFDWTKYTWVDNHGNRL